MNYGTRVPDTAEKYSGYSVISNDIPHLEMDEEICDMVAAALKEDIGDGDVTTLATIPSNQIGQARVIAKETGTLCGLPLFIEVYRQINKDVQLKCWAHEGQMISPGRTILSMNGLMSAILMGERVALNMLGMMSGVATSTSEFVKAVRHTDTKIVDTRKTIPNHRKLQKYAVRVGGGANHRMGLYDMVLIKDNHIDTCGGITQSVRAVRDKWGDQFPIEIETRTLMEVKEAVDAGVDRIMLDNMSIDTMAEALKIVKGRCETEASGGVNLHTVSFIAECGVNYISIGALTHSMRCIDFSLLVDK